MPHHVKRGLLLLTEKMILSPFKQTKKAQVQGIATLVNWMTRGTAPSLPPTVLASHRKSYDLCTTEPKDGRRIHTCLGDTPNLPVSVQAMVLSGISSPLRHKPEVPTEALGAQYSQMCSAVKVETLLLKWRCNKHLGPSKYIKQLFHKHCRWWIQFLLHSPRTEYLLLFCFKHRLWQGL